MKQFAKALEIEAERYRRYERDEAEPNVATLTKIRQLTRISLDHLVAGEPDLVITADASHTHKVKKVG